MSRLHAPAVELLLEYFARFGHVLNADNASELFDEYAASHEARATRVAQVRPAAARVVDKAFETLLGRPVTPGRLPLVVFTSGGNGAGKSTSVAPNGPEHIVFDSTLSQFEPSAANIDRALAAGLHVDVRHLAREVEESWHAVLYRAMNEGHGRTVTLRGFLATHAGAPATFFRLVEHYRDNPRASFLVWQNGAGGLGRRPVEWLRESGPRSSRAPEERLWAILEAARDARRISDAVYRGCAGVA